MDEQCMEVCFKLKFPDTNISNLMEWYNIFKATKTTMNIKEVPGKKWKFHASAIVISYMIYNIR